MSLKIGILGPSGQLGTDLRLLLPQAVPLFKSQVNFLNPSSIQEALGEGGWSTLINCAAMTDVDWCEKNEAETFTINATAVRELARYCVRWNTHLVHLSSDYVFDGLNAPYANDAQVRPLQVYGASKVEAEISIMMEMAQDCRYTIIRTSNLFGQARGRTNFIEKMITAGISRGQIKPQNWRSFVPTSTRALAAKIVELLKPYCPTGVYHSVCGTGATQTEVAQYIFQSIPSLSHIKILGQDKTKTTTPIRPVNSCLLSSSGWELPDWKTEISEYLLQRGYSRPLFVQEVEADAGYSVSKIWAKLGRKQPDIDQLVLALRQDRTNFLIGQKPKRGAKKSINDILGVSL